MLNWSQYRALLFDLDGTLFPTEPTHIRALTLAVQELLDYRMTWEEGNEYIGITSKEMGERLLNRLHRTDMTGEDIRQRKNAIALREFQGLPPYPGAAEFLREARKDGFCLVLASNSIQEFIERCLDAGQIRDCFNHILSVSAVARPKPSPDIFLLAAKQAGANPSNCLAFEDSIAGLEAAEAAGCDVVLVLNPQNYLPPRIPADLPRLTWPELLADLREFETHREQNDEKRLY